MRLRGPSAFFSRSLARRTSRAACGAAVPLAGTICAAGRRSLAANRSRVSCRAASGAAIALVIASSACLARGPIYGAAWLTSRLDGPEERPDCSE